MATVPAMIWGRDELQVGEMWNSNSVISYLLARIGMHAESIRPPAGGRAPGWEAGIVAARSQQGKDLQRRRSVKPLRVAAIPQPQDPAGQHPLMPD